MNPLPDTGQWLLLAMNEHLPQTVVDILRAHIIGLHHYLMLFIMLGFSVLFDSVKAPGLGLGARYLFTMAIGRLLRTITFVSTILPSPRPWCAAVRYQVPSYPHWWAQKYYVPYASDANAIREVIYQDFAYGKSLLSDILPPSHIIVKNIRFSSPISLSKFTFPKFDNVLIFFTIISIM